jgi:G3E family GTPase
MRIDVIGGFLGSGKTSSILHLLEAGAIDPVKTVLLVNEFGKVGVDGALLESDGGSVREMDSGCICCSLKHDFIGQIMDLSATVRPDRIVIEPSGVASMRDVLQALTDPKLEGLVDEIRTVLVMDAEDYDWFVEMSPTFVDAQIGLAQLILVNKADLATPEWLAEVIQDLERRNPDAVVMSTTFGAFSWEGVEHLLPSLPSPEGPTARLDGYESYSTILPEAFSLEGLRLFFEAVSAGHFGEVQRAKGVFRVAEGCMRIDFASHRIHESDWPCGGGGRVNVIGRGLDLGAIERALGAAATMTVDVLE